MGSKIRELSWSLSRARMFEECPRRFYYHYYFSQAGYAPDAPEEAKLALEMKRIKGLDMWVGEVVHQAIQWALENVRSGAAPSLQDAKAETRRRLSEGWQASLKQLWRTHPDDVCPNLFEHYYGLHAGKAVTDRLKNKALLSIANFMASEIFRRITNTPTDRWLPIDKFATFRMNGLLMYVKFDFAMKAGEQLIVCDWKTGVPLPDEIRQLACYAMYTSAKWNVPIENIVACPVHLQPSLDAQERSVGAAEIDEAKAYAKQSFQAMIKCLRNPARNIAVMEDFPMTGNLPRCLRCSFRGICDQGKRASGDFEDLAVVNEWEED